VSSCRCSNMTRVSPQNQDRLSSQVNSPLYMPLYSFSRTAVLPAFANVLSATLRVQYCVEDRTIACKFLARGAPLSLLPRPCCSGELLCLPVAPLNCCH
jgi:hypothetical protein